MATETTSGPIPSPGRRVMEYRLVDEAEAAQRTATNLGESLGRDLEGKCCRRQKDFPLIRSEAAIVKEFKNRAVTRNVTVMTAAQVSFEL